ncbi:MAG: DUF983 domain-containing protein [Hyphomicrobiales bacterium]|nr:DUF983 domain-containing protein [Hyphomicrobiales bacterium]
MAEPYYPPQSVLGTGISGRCPRCGQGHLFKGFIEVAKTCDVCGLDFGFADAGDGPAVAVSLIGGFVVLGLAMWVDLTWSPSLWVIALIFFPLTLLVCLGMLRPLKGMLIAQQFRMKAEQATTKHLQ